ncbi:hypothetical protein N7541_008678 [Penicillium brevicompactum]|uniref:Uncharacterized protein n=1 Tax=Penicillium brevicompactum TaxID=5074 RepID=A0A9W9UQG3_PENBR|nr:hypothetical protein N7541_008678 [Penicillium brevicompactum]
MALPHISIGAENWHQVGAVAQLVARATPVRKVIWSRRIKLMMARHDETSLKIPHPGSAKWAEITLEGATPY